MSTGRPRPEPTCGTRVIVTARCRYHRQSGIVYGSTKHTGWCALNVLLDGGEPIIIESAAVEVVVAPSPVTAGPPLDLLAALTHNACGDLLDLDAGQVRHVIEELLYQVRLRLLVGESVDLPELGALIPHADRSVFFLAAPDLMTATMEH